MPVALQGEQGRLLGWRGHHGLLCVVLVLCGQEWRSRGGPRSDTFPETWVASLALPLIFHHLAPSKSEHT